MPLLRLLPTFLVLLLRPSAASLPPDATTLLSIKSSLSDPDSALSTWTPSTSHCTWRGVSCDPLLRVTSLDISALNLSGTLSPSLSLLPSLVSLSAAANSLTGPIPPSLSLLPALRVLNLSDNILSASFPTALRSLTNLTVLDLYNNNLTGNLPPELASLPNLHHLHLGGNFFSGIIPPAYGQLKSLEYLALSGNALTGPIPPEIGNLTNLRCLYLGYFNKFTGGIPPELGNLTNLIRLDIASSGLTGNIPPEIGNLINLDTLFFQINSLSGIIPPELSRIGRLRSLDLSNNALSGEIPPTFTKLRNLTLLNLFRNGMNGSIPEFISDLPVLEVLQLWENSFSGSIPPKLGSSGRLQILDVSTNKLTGSLPPELCSGNRLETLIALENNIIGPIPNELGQCQSLSRLRLGENQLNGSIPDGLLSLPLLVQVDLNDNLLAGGFPDTGISPISPEFGQLVLSNNRLTGTLPPSIGNFTGMQKLILNQNLLSGGIPPEISKLQQLSKLDFSDNRLSGAIPPEISECRLLAYIDLSRNSLSGKIPTEITTMPMLNYLNLSRNQLSGGIPASIGTMQSLTSLDFSYNKFTGFVQFSYYNASSFAGNPGLCGPYIAPCTSVVNRHRDPLPATFKLVLVTGLLTISITFAVAALIKARSLKKAIHARAWRLTPFRHLNFTCDEVLDCIKDENIIGKGGAGVVYKGVMPDGEQVAVKQLSRMTRGSTLHDHGFSAEVQTLGHIRHRYIVRLLGFCSNHDTNLLVYEYMPNGSLGEVLHGKKGGHLIWETRHKIAVEAAKGLCYLHHDCSPMIVHRDVKSNNILLDSNFEAHVADFGLAKVLHNSEGMSAIAGSYGYIAPEYAYTLRVDEKSDVYSFGVVLLELVTGRKPVGEFGDGVDIVQWVRNTIGSNKEVVAEIVDARLSDVPIHEVKHVFYVAMLCVADLSVERPTMRKVVQILTELPEGLSKEMEASVEPDGMPEQESLPPSDLLGLKF